jgi:RHS repeat-associated protein
MQQVATQGHLSASLPAVGQQEPYYRARYYDSSVGRFISEDHHAITMLGEWPGLYVYAKNDPINLVDPLGLFTLKPGVPYPSLPIQALVDCIEFRTMLPIQITSTTDSHDPNTPPLHIRTESQWTCTMTTQPPRKAFSALLLVVGPDLGSMRKYTPQVPKSRPTSICRYRLARREGTVTFRPRTVMTASGKPAGEK